MSDVGQNATYAISYRTGLRAKIPASLSTENTFSTSSFFSIFNNREGAGPSLLMNLSDDGLQVGGLHGASIRYFERGVPHSLRGGCGETYPPDGILRLGICHLPSAEPNRGLVWQDCS